MVRSVDRYADGSGRASNLSDSVRVHDYLATCGIELSEDEVDHIISGAVREGARDRTVRERLQERLAKVVGISQSKMEKDAKALAKDMKAEDLDSRWTRALLDDAPSREELLLYVCDLLEFPSTLGQHVLGASGADPETVLEGIAKHVARRRARFE